jgi:hypothetical protein
MSSGSQFHMLESHFLRYTVTARARELFEAKGDNIKEEILGIGRSLFAFRLPPHRPGVERGRERGALEAKPRYTRWMVRPQWTAG